MSSMLETLFSQLNLKLSKGCLSKRMSDIFVKIEHEMTGMDNVRTEFKFQQAQYLDLNSLMFANYKNTFPCNVVIGISHHGTGFLFSGVFPGLIVNNAG